MATQKSRFQKWCSRLTRRKILHLLKWEHPMWRFYALTLLMLTGISLIVIGIIKMMRDAPIVLDTACGCFMLIAAFITFHSLPEKRLDQLNHHYFFEICGDIDTLHERLKSGAAHILLETDTLVLTEEYLMRYGDPSTYVPYKALTAFYFGYGGGDSADLAVSASGRNVIIKIRDHDRSRTDEMRRIIEAHAPNAKYGLAEWLHAYSERP